MTPSSKPLIDPVVRTADNPLLVKANSSKPVLYSTSASGQDTKNFTDVLDNLTKNFQTVYTTVNGQPMQVTPVQEAPKQEESFLDSSTLLILGVVIAGGLATWMLMR